MAQLQNSANKSTTFAPAALLADTLEQFIQWRANKKNPAEAIPDELWKLVFKLEEHYPAHSLRSWFNVSSKQFKQKYNELYPPKQAIPPQTVDLVECKPASATLRVHGLSALPSESQQSSNLTCKDLYKTEPLPSGKTLVVELCRADGHIMKIHTTQDSIPSLMQQFFRGLPC